MVGPALAKHERDLPVVFFGATFQQMVHFIEMLKPSSTQPKALLVFRDDANRSDADGACDLLNEATGKRQFSAPGPNRQGDVAGVDLAMCAGVNYPRGPLAWADQVGVARIEAVLANLQASYGEDRYRPSLLLRRLSAQGTSFYES